MHQPTSSRRGLAALGLALPALVASVLGPGNPLDALVRGKWVRFWDTGIGGDTATLCIPAADLATVPSYRSGLAERVLGMHAAGARAVVLDLDLSESHEDDAALASAISAGPTVVPSGASAPPFATRAVAASREQVRTPVGGMVLGLPAAPADGPPMAIAALALSRGEAAPEGLDGAAIVADRIVQPDQGALPFMPYLIPFVHWDDRSTWSTAEGRIVFVGACRGERDLTRYGRQPATVAHGELVETVLAEQRPRQAPPLIDLLLGLSTFALGGVAGQRFGAVGPVGALCLGLGTSLGLSLLGVWAGITPVVLAGVGAAVWIGLFTRPD